MRCKAEEGGQQDSTLPVWEGGGIGRGGVGRWGGCQYVGHRSSLHPALSDCTNGEKFTSGEMFSP